MGSGEGQEGIPELFALVKSIGEQQANHIQQTEKYRINNDRRIDAHKSAIQDQAQAINCMRDHFLKFEGRFTSEYEPMLKESSERRKWWSGIYEEQKKRSVLVVTGVIAVAAMFGLGNALVFLAKKFGEFMRIAAL